MISKFGNAPEYGTWWRDSSVPLANYSLGGQIVTGNHISVDTLESLGVVRLSDESFRRVLVLFF